MARVDLQAVRARVTRQPISVSHRMETRAPDVYGEMQFNF